MSAFPPEPLPLDAQIRRSLAQPVSNEAVEFEGRWLSWGWLAQLVRQIDMLLTEAGLGEGNAIGIAIRNRPPHLAALMAILATRRCVVLLSPYHSVEHLAVEIRSLGLSAVLADAQDWSGGELARATSEERVLGVVLGPGGASLHPDCATAGEAARTCLRPGVGVDIPTSGTSGKPKRIPLTLAGLGASIVDFGIIAAEMGEVPASNDAEATVVQYAPMLHIGGLDVALQMAAEGRRMVLLEKFTAEGWRRAVQRYRPRLTGMPPAMIRILLDGEVPREDVSSVRAVRSGAAPLDEASKQLLESRLGIIALPVYGATEFAGIVASWSLHSYAKYGESKRGSVGQVRRHVADVRVIDPASSSPVAPGAPGLLELRVDRVSPDWLRTSDLASLDEDGFLFILGRADSAINRGGFKILPDDVAAVLRQHPGVFDVCVVALPDERLGQVPAAAVQVRQNAPRPLEEELRALAKQHLAAYQRPVRYLISDTLPRTPAEKIILPQIVESFMRDMGNSTR